MSHKKHFLPIFLLYIITSTAFLSIFCIFLYKFYYSEIIKEANLELRNHTNEIFSAIRMDLNLNNILETLKEHEINANIHDNIENNFILKEFDIPNLRYYVANATKIHFKFFQKNQENFAHLYLKEHIKQTIKS